MPVVDVKDLEGKTVGRIELADAVFAVKPNPHLLHETVRNYLARQRAGTHKTKVRGEVSGAGRKLWRQKGTGRARIGSIRSPLWRHGGTAHGPQPRSYAYRLPRKVFLGALRSALSAKLAGDKLTVVENWQLESHKTKPFYQALAKLDGETRTVLLVDMGDNVNLARASRNIDGVKLVSATALEPYDLMRHERVMLSKDAAIKLGRALGRSAPAAEPVQIAAVPEAAKASADMPKPKLVPSTTPEQGTPAKRTAKPEGKGKRAGATKTKAKPGAKPKTKPKTKKD